MTSAAGLALLTLIVIVEVVEMRRSLALLLWVACLGCEVGEEAPTPPNVQPLLDSYAHQEGKLTKDAAVQIAESLSKRFELIGEVMLLFTEVLSTKNSLDENLDKESDTEEQNQGLKVHRQAQTIDSNFSGWGKLTRHCPGWNLDKERGELNLKAILVSGKLNDTLWGESLGCRFQSDKGPRKFDGDIIFHMLRNSEGDVNGQLFEFRGEMLADDVHPFELDIKLQDDILYLKERVDAGHFLLAVNVDSIANPSQIQLFLRDGDGDWACSFDQTTLNGACEGPGGERISWP